MAAKARTLALLLFGILAAGCLSPFGGDETPAADSDPSDEEVSSAGGPAAGPSSGSGSAAKTGSGAKTNATGNLTGNLSSAPWSRAARSFSLPEGGAYLVALLNLTGADGEPSTTVEGNVTHRVRVETTESADAMFVRVYRIEGDTLVPSSWSLLRGGGTATVHGFSRSATENVSVVLVVVTLGKAVDLRVAAAGELPGNLTEGQPIATGPGGSVSWAFEPPFLPGDGDREGVEYTEQGATARFVRAGTFRLRSDHSTSGPGIHTTIARVVSTAGAADVKLERTVDSQTETETFRIQHVVGLGEPPVRIERDVLVRRSAQDTLEETNHAGAMPTVTFVTATTPWDPASVGLRLAS